MVKKTVEIDVDFPECTVCGHGIFDGEKYFNISIMLSKMTVNNRGGSYGSNMNNSGDPLLLCENCMSNNEMDSIIKLRIIQELEKQKRELETKKNQE